MVGHTGDIEATIVGCKAADEAVKVHVHECVMFAITSVTVISLTLFG
jgi:2,3-bisphosphoglycerate-independent phosphoglycerate mutase